MKKLVFLISLVLTVAVASAQNDDLLQLVDSAYTMAMRGELQQAITINNDGLGLVPADSTELKCEFYSCLLYCYHRLGDYDKALYYGELCLNYDESTGDKANISASLGNLAGIYSSAGRHDVAIEYLNRAIDIENELIEADENHSPKSLAIRKAMLGETLVAKALTLPDDEREPLLQQALDLTEEAYLIDLRLERVPQVGMRLSQLGNIYLKLGNTEKARECNLKALEIARQTNNRATEVITLLQLGSYREAADLAHAIGMKNQELEACRKLAEEAEDKGDFAEAAEMLSRVIELRESIYNEESQRQLTMWQVRYDTQQKEQQLLIQAQTIKSQRMRLIWFVTISILAVVAVVSLVLYIRLQKRMFRNKDRNYAILTHDLKNPMLAQQQMLRMFYKNFDDFDRNEIKENLAKLLTSSDNQLDLLYNLQQMALLENGKQRVSPVRIDLSSIVSEVVSNMQSYADLKHITFVNNVKRSLVVADRNSVRTVLRNLLSNAVKYSYEDGTVEIGNTPDDDGFFVRDYGVGMTDERRKELMFARHIVVSQIDTKGNGGGTGIGLLLCRELIRLNHGTIDIASEPQKGTTITVKLPKSEG
ncbi:MAG: tetratricopeptide repeat-containing sensor histidine kinase [Bacteroidales bacterium]|nr:tetratricopeptide repeat-containing sensor histidine kinase [Bacteroidales bacterium]